jgi:predicted dehydrogenase
MAKYGVVVVGCGVMGAEHLGVINKNEQCDLIGVVDNKPDRASEYAQIYGAPSSSTDISEYLARKDVDIIVITTRPTSHSEIAVKAMRAGKHVFCEKPMAGNLKGARLIIETAKDTGQKILIGFILRSSRLYQRAAEIIASGKIGHPLVMRLFGAEHNIDEDAWQENLRLLMDTSPAIDCGSHYVDVMRWFSNAEVKSISGVGAATENDVPKGFFNYELITMEFDDGSVGTYDAGWGKNYRDFSLKEFIGPNGRLRIIYQHERFEFHEEGDLIEVYTFPEKYEIINVKDPFTDWEGQFQKLIDMIEKDGDPVPALEDACRSLEIVLAGHRSAIERKTIIL